MNTDQEFLDDQQALRLLAGMSVGRVVYTAAALPAVLPVRFRIADDGSLVLGTEARSDLLRAIGGGVIGFESGEIDEADGSGWSVTVLGRAQVDDGSEATPSGPGTGSARTSAPGQLRIRLHPDLVTGRRLRATSAPGG
jgi:hypothetical protein